MMLTRATMKTDVRRKGPGERDGSRVAESDGTMDKLGNELGH
jgi:hypothetical protein